MRGRHIMFNHFFDIVASGPQLSLNRGPQDPYDRLRHTPHHIHSFSRYHNQHFTDSITVHTYHARRENDRGERKIEVGVRKKRKERSKKEEVYNTQCM